MMSVKRAERWFKHPSNAPIVTPRFIGPVYLRKRNTNAQFVVMNRKNMNYDLAEITIVSGPKLYRF
jgi:hypothetical protein